MNALVKKEIRLLFPSWCVAMLLAMVQAFTRPYDFYIASMMFFGLTFMALTTLGREASLKTFSLMLAQPAERIRLWNVKLTVLAAGFLIVFITWLAGFGIAFIHSTFHASDWQNSYNLFISVCLIGAATFTGGLWTTLLLRQVAGALWLTLLVPATLAGFAAVFLANDDSNYLLIAVMSVIVGVYSLGGFLLARWMFFRAQDVGWSGGVIALPEWKTSAAGASDAISLRKRRPMMALVKKEFQLQQASLLGAGALLFLHVSIIVLRTVHPFEERSAGEALVHEFWMIWLVMPAVIGSLSVAEERRLGVMDGQSCLPFSRRRQFCIKAFLTLGLGIGLGGFAPVLIEQSANRITENPSALAEAVLSRVDWSVIGFAACLAVVGFFASTLARNFLQALGFGVAVYFGCALMGSVITDRWVLLVNGGERFMLPLLMAVPTVIVTFLWLGYVNFRDFGEGWPLWRRNLGGMVAAFFFIIISSNLIYHRAWEYVGPAEWAHGPARLSLANPPRFRAQFYGDGLPVQLPDGRFWFDRLGPDSSWNFLPANIRNALNPFPASLGPQKFVAGSNWVSVCVRYLNLTREGEAMSSFVYLDTVGVRSDGTLWVSDHSPSLDWNGDRMIQFGNETNWQAVGGLRFAPWVRLLKKDGTLWNWGDYPGNPTGRPRFSTLREFKPERIGNDSDWKQLSWNGDYAEKADGRNWLLGIIGKSRKFSIGPDPVWDGVDLNQIPSAGGPPFSPYVRKDGTLWIKEEFANSYPYRNQPTIQILRIGNEAQWVTAVGIGWGGVVALRSDGTLWQTVILDEYGRTTRYTLTRLGIHQDWVALTSNPYGLVSLAADGSLWIWPLENTGYNSRSIMDPPRRPKYLGNVLHATE